jgi:MoaA/NifB/PqqE/SkfB family radical SAM enzyme
MSLKPRILNYDPQKWEEIKPLPVNTLQIFITNKCNLRCNSCFYEHQLNNSEISFDEYKKIVFAYKPSIEKVVLMGGEPTLHNDINRMIAFNTFVGLKTTIYTNGLNLSVLEKASLLRTSIRIGIYGATKTEKPLNKVKNTDLPVTIIYMLRNDNVDEILRTAETAEKRFNCKGFYISSIRDIRQTNDYWKDTEETLPLDEYYEVVQEFINFYNGNIPYIHISRRGIIKPTKPSNEPIAQCRFGNIFPENKKIICPLDISKESYVDELNFNKRNCNKCDECLLQKIILRNIAAKSTYTKQHPLKKSKTHKRLPLSIDNSLHFAINR